MAPSILFSHQNFPAQFGVFGSYLAESGWDVTFATATQNGPAPRNCRMLKMTPHRKPSKGVHRFAAGLENAMINGQAFANTALAAKRKGLNPDIVVAHSGWGSGTFAKAVWPDCKYVAYVEWFYRWPPIDTVMSSRQRSEEDGRAMALAKNAPTLLDLAEADLVFCPTRFQADQFPETLRRNMIVMHDGVNTNLLAPKTGIEMSFNDHKLPDTAEVITYATRGMEPHRGFPEFMRALSELQKVRPNLHAIIGGEDRVAYGPKLGKDDSWKKRMLAELDLDLDRIHFVGLLGRQDYTRLLQSAHVHVYLTVPFVLSWSLIEAMSVGAPLVVSDTQPVREALRNDETALMIDHKDIGALRDAIARQLDDRKTAIEMGKKARADAIKHYSSDWIFPARAEALWQLIS